MKKYKVLKEFVSKRDNAPFYPDEIYEGDAYDDMFDDELEGHGFIREIERSADKNRQIRIIDELSVWAARYAIPRQSYASNTTAQTLKEAAEAGYLTCKTMLTIISDIDEAIERGDIQYDDQVRDWKNLRDALDYQLNLRECCNEYHR